MKIPKLDPDDGADANVWRFRNPNHKPALVSGRQYVLRNKSLDLFYACTPINDLNVCLTQKVEEARRWSAEWLNRSCWDWTLLCEAVDVTPCQPGYQPAQQVPQAAPPPAPPTPEPSC